MPSYVIYNLIKIKNGKNRKLVKGFYEKKFVFCEYDICWIKNRTEKTSLWRVSHRNMDAVISEWNLDVC